MLSRMERCHHCKSSHLVEMDDCVTCSSCARVQNAIVFGAFKKNGNRGMRMEFSSNSILDELTERLGLDYKTVSSIEKRFKLLKTSNSSYTHTQIVSALHYVQQKEDGLYTSTLGYTQIYNGCTDSETLGKCVKYVTRFLELEQSDHVSEWAPLIEPYVKLFHLSEKDVELVESYCEKIFERCGASVYDIAKMSIVMYGTDCKGWILLDALSELEEKHKVPKNSLSNMYFKLRKKYFE